MKLFMVKFRGLDDCYVVADDPAQAYKKAANWYEKNDYVSSARRLISVTLMADEKQHGESETRLFL